MTEDTILVERRGPLAIVRLNRPAQLNAVTVPMMAEFERAVADLDKDPSVIALAITGEGRGFCAGFDMAALVAASSGGGISENRTEGRGMDPELPAQFISLTRLSKPVIAAVNGPAAGLGFILAMTCDIRFAAPEAAFVTAFSKRGLIAEHGASWFLPRIVGPAKALDLLWTSRKMGAVEAERIGFVDRLVDSAADLLPAIEAYVAEIAANVSPRSVGIMKRQVYAALSEPVGPAVREGDRLTREALAHPDAREGSTAFAERRAPNFAPWTGTD